MADEFTIAVAKGTLVVFEALFSAQATNVHGLATLQGIRAPTIIHNQMSRIGTARAITLDARGYQELPRKSSRGKRSGMSPLLGEKCEPLSQ